MTHKIEIDVSSDGTKIRCKHRKEQCDDCNIDWTRHNALAETIRTVNANANANAKLAEKVQRIKEEGNKYYKKKSYTEAIQRYTLALETSATRPPWELQASMKMGEELVVLLSNRSTSYYESKQYVEALIDAEAVTELKRDWSKGWFRKGHALAALNRHREAAEAYQTGLRYDPTSEELQKALKLTMN